MKVAQITTFTSWSQHHFVATKKLEWRVRRAAHCGSKQQQESSQAAITIIACSHHLYMGIVLRVHCVHGE